MQPWGNDKVHERGARDAETIAHRVKQFTYAAHGVVLELLLWYVTTVGVRPWHTYFPYGQNLNRIFKR